MRGVSFPPPTGGGTDDVVVLVRDGDSSSLRPSRAPFPPPVGGGTNQAVVQVRDATSTGRRPFRSQLPSLSGEGFRAIEGEDPHGIDSIFLPSRAPFPPPAGGGTGGFRVRP